MYEKSADQLALYASTQFKNGSDVVLCLHSKQYLGIEEPVMPGDPSENDKRVWDYKMADLVKIEQVLKNNLRNLLMYIKPSA